MRLALAGGFMADSPMQHLGPHPVAALFRAIAQRLALAREDLAELDGAIGDGDHGNSMAFGFERLALLCDRLAREGSGAGALFPAMAEEFLDTVGATTGPLYASALLQAAKVFGPGAEIAAADLPLMIGAFAEGIALRGKAQPGDKTMLDAWGPAARAAEQARRAGAEPLAQLEAALIAAREGANATRAMVASRGRAARLGERSLGHIDPGAASAVIIIEAIRDRFAQSGGRI